jgi:hypothetical protein
VYAAEFPTGADAPTPVGTQPSSIRARGVKTILRTATACGWRTAGLRPHGTLAGDAEGFPNLVVVHGGAGRVWYLLVRQGRGALPGPAQMWGETLIRAGAVWRVVVLPDDVDQLCADLADAVRPT